MSNDSGEDIAYPVYPRYIIVSSGGVERCPGTATTDEKARDWHRNRGVGTLYKLERKKLADPPDE